MTRGMRRKAELAVQKQLDGDLVGRVQHDRQRPAGAQRAVGQAEAGKAVVRRRREVEPAGAREVERRQRRLPALGIRAGVLNRQPHVGDAELRDDRAVDQLHHRVHDRLRVDDDVDLIGGDVEQPVRLDHLEPLVHQRRRVDGDLPAHLPRRMLQRRVRRRRARAPRAAARGTARPTRSGSGAGSRRGRGRAGTGEWRCARCRPAGSRRRAGAPRSVTSAPAMTSTSLLASAIVLPASIAASTASRPAVPDEAQMTMSTDGCVATAISPPGRCATIGGSGARRRAGDRRRRPSPSRRPPGDSARPARPAARRCRRRRAPRRAAASGCASTTASALRPIEPVEPRMARRFTRRSAGRGRTPASRTAARRCDRARRRGRGSASSCPSRRPRA